MNRLAAVSVIALALGALIACGEPLVVDVREPSATTAAGTDPTAVTEVPAATATEVMARPGDEPSLLEEATLGKRLVEGRVESSEGPFSPGEPIYLQVRVREVPEKLASWVTWLGPDGSELATQQAQVPPSGIVMFEARGTADWPPGEHTAEIYVGGDLVAVETFEIGPAAKP